MAFAWKKNFSYSKYASVCSQTVRQALKPEIRSDLKGSNNVEFVYAKWKNGNQEPAQTYRSADAEQQK
ncbi:F1-FO ATP synthase epsilon subunit [Schizosaccharomyces osmophilus]|uniref:F1-FO ATP synthase epsilon subunit n=1 Tax=Schizosaccharomyces osmophilus TaxID=2545709 RepID=A0AAF0AWA7_9SCHI|nr:F1-FO ATP synthase epsilon subunit [Schizosaccharomyces osmophilus]WBW72724.1 F1-FO ATP synthase epsilon subunit [Schizosaccharomyces osmophilus]